MCLKQALQIVFPFAAWQGFQIQYCMIQILAFWSIQSYTIIPIVSVI